MTSAPNADYWRLRPRAPAPGTEPGPVEDLPDGDAKEYVFGRSASAFVMFVVRQGERLYDYLNDHMIGLHLVKAPSTPAVRRRRSAGSARIIRFRRTCWHCAPDAHQSCKALIKNTNHRAGQRKAPNGTRS
jgi:hypothetical protein